MGGEQQQGGVHEPESKGRTDAAVVGGRRKDKEKEKGGGAKTHKSSVNAASADGSPARVDRKEKRLRRNADVESGWVAAAAAKGAASGGANGGASPSGELHQSAVAGAEQVRTSASAEDVRRSLSVAPVTCAQGRMDQMEQKLEFSSDARA